MPFVNVKRGFGGQKLKRDD